MKNDKKIILGVNSFFRGPHHDNGAFLFYGDRHVGINSERLDKYKQSNGYKYKVSSNGNYVHYDYDRAESSIDYCLGVFDILPDDVDVVVYLEGLPEYVRGQFPDAKIYGIYDHHLCHVFSAYFSSGYNETAVLVVDGQGKRVENKNDTMVVQSSYFCKDGNIQKIHETIWKDDRRIGIGTMYEMVTRLLDFSSEGTTMGLSSYSSKRQVLKEQLLKNYKGSIYANDSLIKDISGSRLKFLNKQIFLGQLTMKQEDLDTEKIPYGMSADIAAQLQYETEENILSMAHELYKKTNCKNLCIVGGVGLNSVANGRVLEETPFENVYIPPSTDDSGLAFGCALYGKFLSEGLQANLSENYRFYFGKQYSQSDIQETIQKYSKNISKYKKCEDISKKAAELLNQGNIIGWFQGGSESGPRALGNRSILADPRSIEIRDKVNIVKKREDWRPFAPSILTEYLEEYFSLPKGKKSASYKYMLLVVDALEKAKNEIPGVVHIDGTARIQEVDVQSNELYHSLIREFHKLSGVPVVLNTSFNTKGEPIVETPEDAMRMFLSSELDFLVLGDYLIKKTQIYPEYCFKRGIILYDRLYRIWEKEIEEYGHFLQELETKYPKDTFHYEI